MYKPVFYLVVHFSLFLVAPTTSSSIITSLSKGSSLSTSQDTVISSPNHDYAAGFHPVGENAYSFAIWFGNLVGDDKNHTIVWMANRDKPVNGRHSSLSLTKSGNLVLTDASQHTVWKTETQSDDSVELELLDTGNFVLTASDDKRIIWQSFDTPTDTLLPGQALTKNSKLVSLRSLTNYSSGFYKLHFSDDNVLQLLYEGLEMSGVYWPPTWLSSFKANRSTYNNSRIAVLDPLGQFNSTDNFNFRTTDYGGGIQRRLTLDIDGNLRVYSLNKQRTSWEVSWQLNWQPCTIHGLCGLNSLCTYSHDSGRKCTCLQRHKMKNVTDWSYGCEPDFKLSCPDSNMVDLVHLRHVEFYGYDSMHYRNATLEQCKQYCLHACDCKGFQFKFETEYGVYVCLLKTLLFNGYRSPSWQNSVYIKLPKDVRSSEEEGPIGKLQCERTHEVLLERTYKRKGQYGWLKSFIGFAVALGMFEVICLISYLITTLKHSNATFDHQVYIPVVNRFKRFTHAELKKATSNFRDEIGQGSSGVVYKGKLPDNRIAAIKCLKLEANQGEAEFLAEVSTIGKLNHMNLIDICGYCAEGKHRLLVYEYMEHGSLADNLHANNILDWQKRFEIALGTAKGLAYLHEECLEWVLHCDIKPQNILLDSNYEPKVADFGLSRLLNRSGVDNSCFSTIRGTRGYMAPEWIFHHPITSKVDVYSYGILLLELITGKSPNRAQSNNMDNDEMQDTTLVTWVREKMHGVEQTATQIQQVVDPSLDGVNYLEKMEVLIKVALQCSEEDRDARPTMSQVVDMLQA